MREGHVGVKSECIHTKQSHNFLLALSYLEHQRGQGWFVLHVHPRGRVKGGLSPDDFLVMLGFEEYPETCPHLNRPCYFKLIYQIPSKSVGLQVAVREFNRFVESIHELYSLAEDFTRRAGEHSDFVRWGRQFSCEAKVLDFTEEEPPWLVDWRVPEHEEALDALEAAEQRVKHFHTIQYCLWGTGDDLVDSVHYMLTDLGLEADKTKEGATVDLILDYPPKDVEMGMEVTGLSGKIGKRSPKMNQAFTYIQECQDNCKGVIVANTHNNTPLTERKGLEHFTEPAVKLMEGMEIVGLTTMDLYRIWQDVTSGDVDINIVVGEICDHEGGVYRYTH